MKHLVKWKLGTLAAALCGVATLAQPTAMVLDAKTRTLCVTGLDGRIVAIPATP